MTTPFRSNEESLAAEVERLQEELARERAQRVPWRKRFAGWAESTIARAAGFVEKPQLRLLELGPTIIAVTVLVCGTWVLAGKVCVLEAAKRDVCERLAAAHAETAEVRRVLDRVMAERDDAERDLIAERSKIHWSIGTDYHSLNADLTSLVGLTSTGWVANGQATTGTYMFHSGRGGGSGTAVIGSRTVPAVGGAMCMWGE